MIARLEVTRGSLTEYPLAEKVCGGWQNGVMFYPDAEVTKVTPLIVRNETSTDDDQDAMAQIVCQALEHQDGGEECEVDFAAADAILAAGFRRFEVPEPRSCSDVHPTTSHLLPHAEPQGEPSDAQVLAALNAEDNMRAVQGGYKPREKPEPLSAWKAHDIERMRSVVEPLCVLLGRRPVAERDYLVQVNGEFVRDSRGHLVKFTEAGAHKWAHRKRPQSYSVVRKGR